MANPNQARTRSAQSSRNAADRSLSQQPQEPSKRTSLPPASFVLIALHALLGLGALGGGAMLIVDPSGEAMGMPLSMLQRTLFPSFLIPGIVLLVIFGIFPLSVAYAIWRRPNWPLVQAVNPYRSELHPAWALSLYVGFGQIIWITVQTYMMNGVHGVHLLYMAWGLAILVVTLLPSVRARLRLISA